MLAYRPSGLVSGAPLVVVLHGCGQDAAAFAAGSGWMALADRVGVGLVVPTQSPNNNRQGCFNSFAQAQVARSKGEAGAIRAMVAEAVRRIRQQPARHLRRRPVGGRGNGGGDACREARVFAAGASVAGLPVGAATGVASALSRMAQAGPGGRSPEAWADQVRNAAPAGYGGPWPHLSISHGGMESRGQPGQCAPARRAMARAAWPCRGSFRDNPARAGAV